MGWKYRKSPKSLVLFPPAQNCDKERGVTSMRSQESKKGFPEPSEKLSLLSHLVSIGYRETVTLAILCF